jgi:hypothetical protein
MKKSELYRHLIEIAAKLDIRVSEQNLQVTNINAKSGLCQVKNEYVFIMDKKLTLSEKVDLLSECLKSKPLDAIYIVPAVREYLIGS